MNEAARSSLLLSILEGGLPLGAALVRADGSIAEESEGFASLLGTESGRLDGRVAQAHREALAAAMAAVADGVPERILEVRAARGDPERPLELLLRRGADSSAPLAVMVRDRSDTVLLERRLVQSERLRLVGGMLLGCAHELGNLLEVAAQIEGSRDETEDEDGVLMRRALDDALRLVRRLQDFTRQEEPRTPPIAVDVRQILADALEFTRIRWQREAVAAGVSIGVDAELLPAGVVLGSPSDLRHAVANLIANAVDAMPHGGRLRVACRRESAEAVIEIADTGTGISPEIQVRIFEPFFSTKGERGLGLGLSVVSETVSRHGGRMHALSLPEAGSRFEIRLPIAGDRTLVPTETLPTAPPQDSGAPSRILLVDDNHTVRRLIARTLRGDGHDVLECASAEEAAALPTRPGDFDLLVLDVSLPGHSGLNLARTLRARGHHAPVLLITAWGLDLASVDAARVLHKPFGVEALRLAIAEIRGARR
jgi:signal transduction histidine kinase